MPDNSKLQTMLLDPEYLALSPSEQRQVLAEVSGNANLATDDTLYNSFVANLKVPKKRTRPQGEALKPRPSDPEPMDLGNRETLENLAPDIATGLAGAALDRYTAGIGSKLLRAGIQIGGRGLAHYGTQAAQANLPSNISPFKYQAPQPTPFGSFIEGVFDKGFTKAGDVIGDVYQARKTAGGVKNALRLKLGEMFPKTSAEAETLKEATTFARFADAPNPMINALGGGLGSDTLAAIISPANRVKWINQSRAAIDRQLSKAFGGKFQTVKELTEASPAALAQDWRTSLLKSRRIDEGVEHATWKQVDAARDASELEVLTLQPVPASPLYGPNGQLINAGGTQLVPVKNKIKGAIEVDDPISFAQAMKEKLGNLDGDPSEIFVKNMPLLRQIQSIEGIVNGIANTSPVIVNGTSKFIIPYETTKALRNGISRLLEVTNPDSSQAALHGLGETLRGLISQAEQNSIGRPDLGWIPGSEQAYKFAKDMTKSNVDKWSYKTGGGIMTEARELSDKSSLGIDVLKQQQKATGSLQGMLDLVKAERGDPTNAATHFFKGIFSRSLNPDGTLNGKAFYDALYDGEINQSILNSPEIFNSSQRKVIRGLASYAKNNKFEVGKGLSGWLDSKILYGTMAFGIGSGQTLVGGSLNQGMTMGGAMMVGIPMAKHAIESFILNKKGAELLTRKLYGTTSQQQSLNLTKEMLKLLPRGAQVYLIDSSGGMHNAETDENGKVKLLGN